MKLALERFRLNAGMNQKELADIVGKSVRTIQLWEKGQTYPPADLVWSMCEVLGCDPNSLLGWKSDGSMRSDERELLDNYREMSPSRKRVMLEMVEDSAKRSKEQEEGSASFEMDEAV